MTMINKINTAGWSLGDRLFYSTNALGRVDLENGYEEIKRIMIGTVKSKFVKHSILGPVSGSEPHIVAIAAQRPTEITIEGYPVTITERSMVAFFSEERFEILSDSGYVMLQLGYADKVDYIGNGPKKFEVVARINDEYRLNVFAETEDEAIAMAYNHDISEWEHPVIEPHLEDRRIIRHARWGNLSAKEIS